MITVWSGAAALSQFKIHQLESKLASIGIQEGTLSASTIMVINSPNVFSEQQVQTLSQLLQATLVTGFVDDQTENTAAWFVLPRLGTRSPWSSKATDILHQCDISVSTQVEQGIRFTFSSSALAKMTAQQLSVVKHLHFDPMTQSLVENFDALLGAFDTVTQRRSLGILEQSAEAISKANQSLGLALSHDEVLYLAEAYDTLNRQPTDVELMMFAQANSEHCRHKIFNAAWEIDGQPQPLSLFDMIRNTHHEHPEGVLSAYSDNAAVMQGEVAERFMANAEYQYQYQSESIHTLLKVETHNHPTAIAPFSGAATGAGGEIRDEGATGRGAKPKAGLVGFSVSNLNIPESPAPWELEQSASGKTIGKPKRQASPLDIMIEAPIGAASFNNEFGRPNLLGYFRTFEMPSPLPNDQRVRGYHKPIMLAGGIGNIRDEHVQKNPIPGGAALIVLGGPALLIGLGGGAASSVDSGSLGEDLDFASVQRGNPEMQRRAQEVIDRCWAMGGENPIQFIHDVGAGGLSNALPELVKDGGCGGIFELAKIHTDDPALSPMELWCNEAQERYVLSVLPEHLELFNTLCVRERCPYAVVGRAVEEKVVVLNDPLSPQLPVDLPQSVLFGKSPKLSKKFTAQGLSQQRKALPALSFQGIELNGAIERVLQLPSVASKSFLITIGDRTITGLVHRDQMVGPWQVPVADCAVTAFGFNTAAGEALAMGERTPLALLDPAASARMAIGESITNLLSAPVDRLSDITLSANWMAACGDAIEDQALFEAVKAVGMELCPELGLTIPVGKDSLSMSTRWHDAGTEKEVVSPMSLVVSALAKVSNIRESLTPLLSDCESTLYLLDFAKGQQRLGGSALAQVYGQVGNQAPDFDTPAVLRQFCQLMVALRRIDKTHSESVPIVSAYHDRSDGGLFVALTEMAFASHCGLTIQLDPLICDTAVAQTTNYLSALFTEELGVVLQVPTVHQSVFLEQLECHGLAAITHPVAVPHFDAEQSLTIMSNDQVLAKHERVALELLWQSVSLAVAKRRDNPDCIDQLADSLKEIHEPGLSPIVTFEDWGTIAIKSTAPKIAVLREQGVNGQLEMAAAFDRAGFECIDVHMSDLIAKRRSLSEFSAMVACGGFSYGDVLGAGSGWAKSILFNEPLAEQFQEFFSRKDTLTLGVCNGCQMLSQLKDIIPGAEHWPLFKRNLSEQFEARLVAVTVGESHSPWFKGMSGSILPIAVAHGEGKIAISDEEMTHLKSNKQITLQYVNNAGNISEQYPYNPNGSSEGITGVCSKDGRASILMPHPERVFQAQQFSWCPPEWGERSPWFRVFANAQHWLSQV